MGKSTGVSIFAFLFILIGLLGTLFSLNSLLVNRRPLDIKGVFLERIERYPDNIKYALVGNPYVEQMLDAFGKVVKSKTYNIVLIVNLIMCFIVFLLGIGIWRLKEWARKTTIVFFVLSIPLYTWIGIMFLSELTKIFKENNLNILLYISGIHITSFFTAVNFIFLTVQAAVVVGYFVHPEIKRQFR